MQVAESHVGGSVYLVTLLHTVEVAVGHVDVYNVLGRRGQTVDENTIFTLAAVYATDVHVANNGRIDMVAVLFGLIEQVNLEHTLVTYAHVYVANPHVLYYAATAVASLDADHTIQFGAIHIAVLDPEVAEAARYLAAEHHAAVTVLHLTVANVDVLCALAIATIVVATALDGNAVVARVERAILCEHIGAALGVAAVAIGTEVVEGHATHCKVGNVEGVQGPKG